MHAYFVSGTDLKHFKWVYSSTYDNIMKQMLILPAFHTAGHWGTQKARLFAQVMQPVNGQIQDSNPSALILGP